ncbi:hypothetical protein UXA55_07585 [Aeromonas caviae]|uniref:hypothetical protein n=1 Tax=Aeromonas caviae TaxID=648 RepID=UPI002AB4B1B4|nr:hypothetical protein [Aeromonas caviae]MDY7829453.1 hypothetical protein [Aeromonas caviae]
MPNIKKIANAGILLSHNKFYGASRSFNKILGRSCRKKLLLRLSILSYEHHEEPLFREWSIKALCKNKKQQKYAKEHSIFSRLQCWRLWTVIFNEWEHNKNSQSHRHENEVLHEVFAKLNDKAYDAKDDTQQAFIKAIVSQGRDNRVSKLRRAQHILCSNSPLTTFINKFEQHLGTSLALYLNIIYFMIEHWHKMIVLQRTTKNIELDKWAISAEWLSHQLNISEETVLLVLNEISFTIPEGREFSKTAILKPNEFTLYRERPLLEIENNKFIPVEGKLFEESLFETIFHKIHHANNNSIDFFNAFGFEFEKYAQSYAMRFSQDLSQYKTIEEFPFKAGKDRNLKSPDFMLKIQKENCIVVFEVKSARPLYNSLTTENTPQYVADSLEKLQYKPWEQTFKSLSKIVKHDAHPDFNKNIQYIIVSVTMNNYPMTLQENIIKSKSGNDISAFFYSIDIETFEVLMRAARLSSSYSIRDILFWCYEKRHEMSEKTTIVRYIKTMLKNGVTEDNVYTSVLNEALTAHQSYFRVHDA